MKEWDMDNQPDGRDLHSDGTWEGYLERRNTKAKVVHIAPPPTFESLNPQAPEVEEAKLRHPSARGRLVLGTVINIPPAEPPR